MTTDNDMKDILLDAAAVQARKTVEAVKATGLQSGFMEEEVGGADQKYEITTVYYTQTSMIQITIIPVVNEDLSGPDLPPGMMMMFGGGHDPDEIRFSLPEPWLPKAVEVTGHGG